MFVLSICPVEMYILKGKKNKCLKVSSLEDLKNKSVVRTKVAVM